MLPFEIEKIIYSYHKDLECLKYKKINEEIQSHSEYCDVNEKKLALNCERNVYTMMDDWRRKHCQECFKFIRFMGIISKTNSCISCMYQNHYVIDDKYKFKYSNHKQNIESLINHRMFHRKWNNPKCDWSEDCNGCYPELNRKAEEEQGECRGCRHCHDKYGHWYQDGGPPPIPQKFDIRIDIGYYNGGKGSGCLTCLYNFEHLFDYEYEISWNLRHNFQYEIDFWSCPDIDPWFYNPEYGTNQLRLGSSVCLNNNNRLLGLKQGNFLCYQKKWISYNLPFIICKPDKKGLCTYCNEKYLGDYCDCDERFEEIQSRTILKILELDNKETESESEEESDEIEEESDESEEESDESEEESLINGRLIPDEHSVSGWKWEPNMFHSDQMYHDEK